MNKTLDLICLGRAAVDFYGQQIGGRLEDMQTFAKYLGGSSANLAAGASRLGVRTSMLTRVIARSVLAIRASTVGCSAGSGPPGSIAVRSVRHRCRNGKT